MEFIDGQSPLEVGMVLAFKLVDDNWSYPEWFTTVKKLEVTEISTSGEFWVNDFSLDPEEIVNFEILEE